MFDMLVFLARAINLTENQQSQIAKYPVGTSPVHEKSPKKSHFLRACSSPRSTLFDFFQFHDRRR